MHGSMIVRSRRDVLAGSLSLALMPAAAPARAGEPDAGPSDLAAVDPELRAVVGRRMAQAIPPLGVETLAAWRARLASAAAPIADAPAVVTRSLPLPGAPDVIVHVVGADPARRRPAVLHLHGGGFVMGTARGSIAALQRLARDLDCVVVTVEYRLAPETTFAGSTADTYAALSWLWRSAAELGVDRDRIAVLGESAGGGHAALLALAARDRGGVKLAYQVLIYPMLDDRTGSRVVPSATVGRFVWTAAQNRFGWGAFLGRAPGGADIPRSAVPARRLDLGGLPPTFIGVGGLDLFVDEGIDYARRLVAAGVPTELLVVPRAYHAFDLLAPDAAVSRRFTTAWRDALRRAFAKG